MSDPPPKIHSRKNPFLATLTHRWLMTKPGSQKETHGFIINLEGSNLTYNPGDSLGVFAHNPPDVVDELILLLGFDPNTLVGDPPTSLRQHLLHHNTLNRAGKKFLIHLHEFTPPGTQRNQLEKINSSTESISEYLYDHDYVDILREFSDARFPSPQNFIALLPPVIPRLYSIASSLQAHPNEAHLCIGIVRYESHGREKKGLCSGFFADHTQPGTNNIPVYIQPTPHFLLPKDGSRDIIMIGPGTGVAPYRAFLEQRVLDGSTGRNWLIFGEQHRATDFFYEDEFSALQKKGKLHRLDVAFSRDQKEKIYVQHRLRENGRQAWEWIQNGAYFYVCGDAKRMAKDVHHELIQIAREQGGLSEDAAADYVNNTLLKTEHRYLRDIY